MPYPKIPYQIGRDTSVLQCNRVADKTVNVRPNLPGNIIVIHGVNDVGVAFDNVEQGLCEGLKNRLGPTLTPATYRMPTAADKDGVLEDPDAVFFRRSFDRSTRSPVIPFYWGFREVSGLAKSKNGQKTDRYGNRLDKDLSKGGGPFGNATSTLPDMWNKGFSAGPGNALDKASQDPLRPVLRAPGRMYMVLAAKRLAALIAMIRDYDANEAVSLVAHSQGCMLSLLAQAFLLQDGQRPADTLVLTHPPYSLVDDVPWTSDAAEMFHGGEDKLMEKQYRLIADRQTFVARLQTLINLVEAVHKGKATSPEFQSLSDPCTHYGMVGKNWKASADRDNRGKVYLYFCPEDMTVALNNVQGIGWQGVPCEMEGHGLIMRDVPVIDNEHSEAPEITVTVPSVGKVTRQPLKELGAGFFQRVFTAKQRPDPSGKIGDVLIGHRSPHEFSLRKKGEDDHAHVAAGSATLRTHLPDEKEKHRAGVRRITGDPLPNPVKADLWTGGWTLNGQPKGAHEEIDPIDSATAVTSDYGLLEKWLQVKDPENETVSGSKDDLKFTEYGYGIEARGDRKRALVEAMLNKGKPPGQCCKVLEVYYCIRPDYDQPETNGNLAVKRTESPDESRLRWQKSYAPRSFHGAIFGSRQNHANVTAYDVAIGGGTASSDPNFYAYLCAVADWRLTTDKDSKRPVTLKWDKFLKQFSVYWNAEPLWRKELIKGNADYYATGNLPNSLPVLPSGLPQQVVSETTGGQRIPPMRVKA
jgi:hypothetical protein